MDRKSTYPIEPFILHRWSPRAMSGESIPIEELMSLFEAARWAPSSFNNQPWRFIFAQRDSEHWQTFVQLLNEFNQSWASRAAVLVVVVSKKTFDFSGKPSRTSAFDTGAAWENLALEASARNFVAHGMEGFDYEEARAQLHIPNEFDVQAMIAIGRHGSVEELPATIQEREFPSDRRPLEEIVMEGVFQS